MIPFGIDFTVKVTEYWEANIKASLRKMDLLVSVKLLSVRNNAKTGIARNGSGSRIGGGPKNGISLPR